MLGWTKPQFKDDIEDGWDASLPYQMVPTLGKRYMMLRTGPLRVELTVAQGLSAGLANFHVVRPFGKVVPELPTSGQTVRKVTIPAETEVQFDITAGAAAGHGFLEVRQLHHGDLKSPSPELQLLVSVKNRTTRNFLICDVFDQINKDIGIRARIGPAMLEANRVYTEQANVLILKTGEVKVELKGSVGAKFDPVHDHEFVKRIIKATKDKQGSDVFDINKGVIYLLQVPIEVFAKGVNNVLLGYSPTYKLNNRLHRATFLAAPTAASDVLLPVVVPHEMGHLMGLEHVPEDIEKEFPKDMPIPQKEAKKAQAWIHNLMFPSAMPFGAKRLTYYQIEYIHQDRTSETIVDLD